jgi:hypothetical protein
LQFDICDVKERGHAPAVISDLGGLGDVLLLLPDHLVRAMTVALLKSCEVDSLERATLSR